MSFNFVKHWPIRNLINDAIFLIYGILATDGIKDELVKSGHLSNEDVPISTKLWQKYIGGLAALDSK